jgi:putative tryptophan/tyrosine transport system substrate-binding protein
LKMDVIVTSGTPAIGALQKATATIPIVMGSSGDPVGSGFVKSLARPGTNITGLSIISAEIVPKLLELLVAMVPKLARVAYISNPTNQISGPVLKSVQVAAQKVGIYVFPMEVRSVQEIESAFAMVKKQNVGAVIVAADSLFIANRDLVASLAAKLRLPSISSFQGYVRVGGLMSYGPNAADGWRRAAVYVDKILKGAKPSELPVEQPTRIELEINLKTAKALGLKIPESVLFRADRVIE